MKKLLLLLTFTCFFVSSSMMAQQTTKANNTTKKIQRKGSKVSKNAVIRINEVPVSQSTTSKNSNRNTKRKERIVYTNTAISRGSARKVSHREMIAKRKQIAENY